MRMTASTIRIKSDFRNSFLYKHKTLFTIFLFMLSGVFSAIIIYNSDDSVITSRILESFKAFAESVNIKSKPEIFSGLLLNAFICYLLILLFSTSAIGIPLIYATVYFKLLGLSMLIFCIYSQFGLNGIEFAVLVLLPGKIFLILSLLILSESGENVSLYFLKGEKNKGFEYKKTVLTAFLSGLLILASVTVDYFVLTLFFQLFNFC